MDGYKNLSEEDTRNIYITPALSKEMGFRNTNKK